MADLLLPCWDGAGRGIESSSKPARLGRSVPYTHLVMAAGVILTGVGYELVIDHPLGHLNPGWLAAIFGGPVLFLAGRSVVEYEVFARCPDPGSSACSRWLPWRRRWSPCRRRRLLRASPSF
ncbi:low temperature requirement protein A [Micromonospora sp. ATCC 39149]|uniref:Low temperature requirement protein A n=1 Tax=Micromonospora carbonacea TaxID=47853 RepID=A0A7D5Y8R6_9ACTN|nr:low temperature requirement protein A [Micromonospora carbonacea]